MTALLAPMPKQRFFTNANLPASGYNLYTYTANTTNLLATYSNRAGTVQNTNPIVLDANGECVMYLPAGQVYDFKLERPDGVQEWLREDIEADPLANDLAGSTASTGAALLNFTPNAVSGAVTTAVSAMLGASLMWLNFGIVADNATDCTTAMNNYIAWARTNKRPMVLPAGTIRTSAALDFRGLTVVGTPMGYRNVAGTVIKGNGTHDVIVQTAADPNAGDTSIMLSNLRIEGGLWGIKTRYMLHSHWKNVFVLNCSQGGIQFGNSSDAGGLFNTFDNIEVDVIGTALDVNGNGYVNANSFNQCYFKGTSNSGAGITGYGARVRCTGGIGAVDNVFNCCEFDGDQYNVELNNTANTVFNQAYFEGYGPALLLTGTRNIGWALNDCVFAGLSNANTTGKTAFIYHAGSGTSRGSVKGGYIYLASGAIYNNLSFVASENPATCYLLMHDQPEQDIASTGFVLLNGLTSANLNLNTTGTYTPTWTGATTNPVLGNGTLVGDYTRSGNMVTVCITLTCGSTTTFGSGAWSFTLPYAAQAQSAGDAYILDSGTGYNGGVALVGDGGTTVSAYMPGTANLVNATAPQVWATNDQLTITLTYRC